MTLYSDAWKHLCLNTVYEILRNTVFYYAVFTQMEEMDL